MFFRWPYHANIMKRFENVNKIKGFNTLYITSMVFR